MITPETCGRTVTVAAGVTVPSASRVTGTSASRAGAMPTVVGGRPPRRPKAPGFPAVLLVPCARKMASPIAAATSSSTRRVIQGLLRDSCQ